MTKGLLPLSLIEWGETEWTSVPALLKATVKMEMKTAVKMKKWLWQVLTLYHIYIFQTES